MFSYDKKKVQISQIIIVISQISIVNMFQKEKGGNTAVWHMRNAFPTAIWRKILYETNILKILSYLS